MVQTLIMNLNIKNKLVLVTGGTKGIGREIINRFLQEGCTVINASRNIKRNKNEKEIQFICDFQNKQKIFQLIKKLKKKKLYPDIIVNNVGSNLNFQNPLGGVEEWEKVFQLNLNSCIILNNAFIENMKKNKWGRICHISSIAALENQGSPHYCASKAAMNAYVRSVGRYVSKDGIIMTAVMPGPIFIKKGYWDKKYNKNSSYVKRWLKERVAINRFGRVDEISSFVVFLCSEHSSFAVGSCFLVDGGQGRSFYPNI